METTSSTRPAAFRFGPVVGWAIVGVLGGLACVVLPPHLFPPTKIFPSYGQPLIPWFAYAYANLSVVLTLVSMAALGFALGFAQPRWWPLSCCLTVLLPITLNAINIAHDWTVDPTSHNLFPFEFVILIFLGSPAILFGLAGRLVRGTIDRPRTRRTAR